MNADTVTGKAENWHRLPDEGDKAFSALQRYLAMDPPRNLRQLASSLGKSYALLRRWSSRHQWRDRARAFDAAHSQQAEETERASRREFARRQQREVQQLWRLAVALLQRLVQRGADGEWDVDPRLGPKEVMGLLKLVADLLQQNSVRLGWEQETASDFEVRWGEPGVSAGQLYTASHVSAHNLRKVALGDVHC